MEVTCKGTDKKHDKGAPAKKADAPKLYPYVPLDQSGQLDGQLLQIGDVQEGITVYAFDTGLVVADGGGCEENLFAGVFLLDAAKVFLGCGAVVSGVRGLAVGHQDQELYRFGTPRKLLRNIAQSLYIAHGKPETVQLEFTRKGRESQISRALPSNVCWKDITNEMKKAICGE